MEQQNFLQVRNFVRQKLTSLDLDPVYVENIEKGILNYSIEDAKKRIFHVNGIKNCFP